MNKKESSGRDTWLQTYKTKRHKFLWSKLSHKRKRWAGRSMVTSSWSRRILKLQHLWKIIKERLKILIAGWSQTKTSSEKNSYGNWPESFINSISERIPFQPLCFGNSTITSSNLISSQIRGQTYLKYFFFSKSNFMYTKCKCTVDMLQIWK